MLQLTGSEKYKNLSIIHIEFHPNHVTVLVLKHLMLRKVRIVERIRRTSDIPL